MTPLLPPSLCTHRTSQTLMNQQEETILKGTAYSNKRTQFERMIGCDRIRWDEPVAIRNSYDHRALEKNWIELEVETPSTKKE
ncbi:hypothetical protein Tcan_10809 [Toxocara canis]|uniref:Uncharacterized protein n=1 Tax=Toxocara canis TaxID=6265 RepID=A0A0B2USE4_TOXCA|nr:hypothetical protein Tcan_10809 [Toxocara canis]